VVKVIQALFGNILLLLLHKLSSIF